MKNNGKTILVAGITALVIASGLVLFLQKPSITTYVDNNGKTQTVGSSGPESPYNYQVVGGVKTYWVSQAINASSSIACAFGNPTNQFTANGLSTTTGATSTLTYASMRVDSNGLGSQTIDISTSTATVLGSGANVSYAFLGSTTPSFIYAATVGTGRSDIIWSNPIATTSTKIIGMNYNNYDLTGRSVTMVGPNEGVTFRIATGTPGVFAASSYPTGMCEAEFTVE